MANINGTHSAKTRTRQVTNFPQVIGKIVERVELSADVDDYAITIRFQDRTALSFDLEPCVTVTPDYADWKTGDWRGIKRWKPIHSKSSRL